MNNLNRRGFIALSSSAVAAALLPRDGQEIWHHHGTPVVVERLPDRVHMMFRVGSENFGLGHKRGAQEARLERMLRRCVETTIDNKTGYTERWLAEQRAAHRRVAERLSA